MSTNEVVQQQTGIGSISASVSCIDAVLQTNRRLDSSLVIETKVFVDQLDESWRDMKDELKIDDSHSPKSEHPGDNQNASLDNKTFTRNSLSKDSMYSLYERIAN